MKRSHKLTVLGLGALVVVGIVMAKLGGAYMVNLAEQNRCHKIAPAEWQSFVAGLEPLRPLPQTAPFRDLAFVLNFPLVPEADAILRVEAYSEGRDSAHGVYEGAVPADRQIAVRLVAGSETGAETYSLFFDLIRPSALMACNWALEETFTLPAAPHPGRWRVDLLAEPVPTPDGGQRSTRLTPLD